MRPRSLSLVAAAFAASLLGSTARADLTTVVVVPFAPLNGQVPEKGGAKSAMLLASELKNLGTFDARELTNDKDSESEAALNAARQAMTEAKSARDRRKFGQAAATYRKAIELYVKAASRITDINELSDAHLGLAVVSFLTGADVDGNKELANAITLTPTRAFEGEDTSPLFRAKVKATRDSLFSGKIERATLQIDSVPQGAQVFVDGVELGRTPLTYRGLGAGLHHWRVVQSSSEPAGGVIAIAPGARQTVTAKLFGTSVIAKLNGLLISNKVEAPALELLKQIAAEQKVEYVAFGGLYDIGDDLYAEPYLYSAAKHGVFKLKQKSYDYELLSAGSAMYEVATEVSTRLENLGTPQTLPSTVYTQMMASPSRNERSYVLPTEGLEATEGSGKVERARGPIDPTKRTDAPRIQLRDRDR